MLSGSSAGSSPSIVVKPSEIAPKSRALCEIDLSPGTLTFPESPQPERSKRTDWSLLLMLKDVDNN